jgi:hypothetical protein
MLNLLGDLLNALSQYIELVSTRISCNTDFHSGLVTTIRYNNAPSRMKITSDIFSASSTISEGLLTTSDDDNFLSCLHILGCY